jgi:hypothetical protein
MILHCTTGRQAVPFPSGARHNEKEVKGKGERARAGLRSEHKTGAEDASVLCQRVHSHFNGTDLQRLTSCDI